MGFDKVTPLPDTGGTSHLPQTTDANGYATFNRVPVNSWFRAKVLNKPPGAIPTQKNQGGNDINDSDLNTDDVSDSYMFEESAHNFTKVSDASRRLDGCTHRCCTYPSVIW